MNTIAAVASLLLIAAPTAAAAHATLWPKESAAGAFEKYQVRVPNEKQVDTVRIELAVPAGVTLKSVQQLAGWTFEHRRGEDGQVRAVVWSGRLAPMAFVEFGVIAVNPRTAGALVWPVRQTYADGVTVAWSGPPGSGEPAPRTVVR